jgi:hypothetical protein
VGLDYHAQLFCHATAASMLDRYLAMLRRVLGVATG